MSHVDNTTEKALSVMKQRIYWVLAAILVLTGLTIWIALPDHPGIHIGRGDKAFDRDVRIHQGLDLQGGIQVLMEADLPEDAEIDTQAMSTARRIIEERVNGLGVTEPLVQLQGSRRIIVELPGIENPEQAVETIKGTALLEFVDSGTIPLPPGTVLTTTLGGPSFASSDAEQAPAPTDASSATDEPAVTAPEPTIEPTEQPAEGPAA